MFKLALLLFLFFSTTTYAKTHCIAHRGNNKDFFENSYQSLYSAIEIGSDGVEFDIVHTLDDVAIINHDSTLKRTATHKKNKNCPLKIKISKLTYQQIHQNCLLKNGEEIPTLENFLEILEDLDIYRFIEFKDSPSNKTFSLIKKYNQNSPPHLRLISFKKSYLKKVSLLKRDDPFWEKVQLLALYRSAKKLNKDYGIDIKQSALSHIEKLQRLNLEISIWTVDSPSVMKKAVDKKINFITTNDPRTCQQVMDSH